MEENKISSLEKALKILEVFSKEPYEFKVLEIAKELNFNRTTVYRILTTLEKFDYVIRDTETDKYKIGSNMYHIGMLYLTNNNYENKIIQILNEISELTKESVGLAILDKEKIISLYEIEVHQPMKLNDKPGRYFAINKGTYGKCIMAFQTKEYINKLLEGKKFEKSHPNTITDISALKEEYEKIRNKGYAVSIDETGANVCGVAIPIYGRQGAVKTTVAVAFYKTDNYLEKIKNFLDVLLAYQSKLEKYFP